MSGTKNKWQLTFAKVFRKMPLDELKRRLQEGGLGADAQAAAQAELDRRAQGGQAEAAAQPAPQRDLDVRLASDYIAASNATKPVSMWPMVVLLLALVLPVLGLLCYFMPKLTFFVVLFGLMVAFGYLGRRWPWLGMGLGVLFLVLPVVLGVQACTENKIDGAGNLGVALFVLIGTGISWLIAGALISSVLHRDKSGDA